MGLVRVVGSGRAGIGRDLRASVTCWALRSAERGCASPPAQTTPSTPARGNQPPLATAGATPTTSRWSHTHRDQHAGMTETKETPWQGSVCRHTRCCARGRCSSAGRVLLVVVAFWVRARVGSASSPWSTGRLRVAVSSGPPRRPETAFALCNASPDQPPPDVRSIHRAVQCRLSPGLLSLVGFEHNAGFPRHH